MNWEKWFFLIHLKALRETLDFFKITDKFNESHYRNY